MRRNRRVASWFGEPAGRSWRRGLAAALAAAMVAIVSFAVAASPLLSGRPSYQDVSAQSSLLHRALIYAKEGSQKLLDGRWNLGQSESKLGVTLSDDQTKQLMACTGEIVCQTPDVHNEEEDRIGRKISASAVSVLRPDMLVTAKHVLFDGKRARVSFGTCSFRNFSNRKVAIPVAVEQDQRKGYSFNNEDFIVLRLKRELPGCNGLALAKSDASLSEGEQVLSVTGRQIKTLNKLSNREPVVAKGTIKRELDGVLGGPPFYYAELDVDDGGSGGGVFALKDGRPVADDEGRLILRGLLVAYGQRAKSGKPYSEDRNYTIIIGLQSEFRDLLEGKGLKRTVEPEACPQGGTAKINVSSEPAPSTEADLPPPPQQSACSRVTAPGRKAKADAKACTARAKPAPIRRVKEKRDYMLKNGTSCRICFTYNRCNGYGCWDETVRLGALSSLSAGTSEQAPVIKSPQFCK